MTKASRYVTYLVNPEQHTNKAHSHAGIGDTREEAEEAARYWRNQTPWVRTVPVSKAPQWAIDEAEESAEMHKIDADGIARELVRGGK